MCAHGFFFCLAVFRQCLHKKLSVAAGEEEEEEDGGRGRGGRERVRQSGRLSGVWTCLAACTKQRKHTSACRVARSRSPINTLTSRAHPAEPPAPLRGDIMSFAGLDLLEAGAGQLAHKHGTGRCYALDPAPSPSDAALLSGPATASTSRAARPFLCFSHRRAPRALHMHTILERLAHRSRSGVTALFSLFEKAMLSASQDDITLRASYWSPSAERPYLKKQSLLSCCCCYCCRSGVAPRLQGPA